MKENGWTVVKDRTGAIGPYAYKGDQWVSYDDVEMIRKKSQLIRDQDLGGGMVWALDLDDFRNTCGDGNYPLLSTIKSVLGRPKRALGSSQFMNPTISTENLSPIIDNSIIQVVHHKPMITTTTPTSILSMAMCAQQPFKVDSRDCSKYYQCVFGRYMPHRCPGGTFWNRVSKFRPLVSKI